jgi:hypothetical protein
MSWLYKNKQIDDISQVPEGAMGFIYKITDSNGRAYIGRKEMFSKRKKHFGKKKLAEITDKRKRTWEYVIKESNWLTYTGSNKELNENIKKGLVVTKEILIFANTKKQLTYYESKMLFCNEVIESDNFYNDNILGKFYRRDLYD